MTNAQRDRRGLVALSLLVVANLVLGGFLVAKYSSPTATLPTTSITPAGEAPSRPARPKGTSDSNPAPRKGASQTPSNTPATQTPSNTPGTQTRVELRFPDGTYEIGGDEVKRGTRYVTVRPVKESCFVTVLSRSGEFLVEKMVDSKDRASITIPAKGSTFSSSGCGTWRRASGPAG